jgi:hypothetical protein
MASVSGRLYSQNGKMSFVCINGLVGYRILLDITDVRVIKVFLVTQNPG